MFSLAALLAAYFISVDVLRFLVGLGNGDGVGSGLFIAPLLFQTNRSENTPTRD